MGTPASRQWSNFLTTFQRSLWGRLRSTPALWLATTSLFVVLASCARGSGSNPASDGTANPQGSAAPSGTTAPTAAPTGAAEAGAPGADAGPPAFDPFQAFQTTIQPILDTAGSIGCTNTSCHGAAAGIGGLTLARQPAAGSAQMQANFSALTALCNLAAPPSSLFYVQATNNHGGIAVSQAQGTVILDWIQHTATGQSGTQPTADAGSTTPTSDAGSTTPTGCVDITSYFNLAYFSTEIQPILFGTVDYNVPAGQAVSNNGCARAACHGSPTNPLNISPSNPPAKNLQNFGCFVNLANPSSSAILQCPLNNSACPKYPHPGQDVFASEQDLNFQRIASWLYSAQPPPSAPAGSKGAASPLDLAFFARQVSTIFDDPAFGGEGAAGSRTCSDTNACHGVSAPGQVPPNLSNFPMLANATTKAGVLINYATASGFANFFTAQGSELFLYPTNEVADVTQPYATGLAHPGGNDIIANSGAASAILTWVNGLRPDGNGNVLNWLVAGTYDANQVTQPTAVGDDNKLAPTIFDSSDTQDNGGIWDLFASPNALVDLTQPFGANGTNRVAYAVANVINTTGSDIQASVTVSSPNAVEVIVGTSIALGEQGGANTANAIALFPAFSSAKTTTRILVKVLQRQGDAQFAFTLNLTNLTNNAPLTNTSGELVFRLDPTGGI